jgi:hypothetical protein
MQHVNTNKIFSPYATPYNLKYEDYATLFWQWLVSIPKESNPHDDSTGKLATNGQTMSTLPVFFLCIGSSERPVIRKCHVPKGKGILIPLMVVELCYKEVKDRTNHTEDYLRRKCKKDQDSVTEMYLRIDNEEYKIEDLSKYRIHTDEFDVKFPQNAIWDVSEGPAKAVADGHYILSKPLSRGEHIVHWKSSLTCVNREGEPKCVDSNFVQNIKYTITVN